MRAVWWLLLGLLIGGGAGWYAHELAKQDVRASTTLQFNDRLADRQVPFLSATGSWRGADLSNKVNSVRIVCDATANNCDLQQADVMSLGGAQLLSMYSKSFRITKLDDRSLVAEGLPDACIQQTLMIDRVARSVTLVRTKISRDSACTVVQETPLSIHLGEPLR